MTKIDIFSGFLGHQYFEKFAVFCRDCEMYIYLTALPGGIHSTFYQMLFKRSARTFFVFMEFEQPFG